MATRMLQRRGTAAEWTAANPVLADGELGIERDTGNIKVGDGVTAWNALSPAWVSQHLVTAKGDLLVGTANATIAKLAAGTTGQRLTVQADGSLAWATDPDILQSIIDAKGDLIVGTADNTPARLAAGAAGAKLAVASDGSLHWVDGSENYLVDAKGDLLVGSADNTLVRLPIGANNTNPYADSTQPSGIRWDVPRVHDRENWSPGVSTSWTWVGNGYGTRMRLRAEAVGDPGWVVAEGLFVLTQGGPYAQNLTVTIPYGNGTAASGRHLGTWAVERGGSFIANGILRSQASSTECAAFSWGGAQYFFQPANADRLLCSFNYPITI